MRAPTRRTGSSTPGSTIVDPATHSWTETLVLGAHPDDVDGLLQALNPHTGSPTANADKDALGSVMILAPIIGVAVGATDPNSAGSYAVLGGTIVGAAAIQAARLPADREDHAVRRRACASGSSSRPATRPASATPGWSSTA